MTAAEVARMPKVTLYVKDVDAPIWEEARQLAGDSLSSVVVLALRSYVDQMKMKKAATSELQRQATLIEIELEPEDKPKRKVQFNGVLAYEDGPDVYVTTSGKVVVAFYDRFRGSIIGTEVFETYNDFVDADAQWKTDEVGAAVAEVIGEEWIETID